MRYSKSLAFTFVLMILASSLGAQERTSDNGSAREFVQAFYDWYAPGATKAAESNKDFGWQKRASCFDTKLVGALKEDENAQSKAKEIVGLDFDPFLSGQDPCAPYKAGDVVRKEGRYFVEVNAECPGVTVQKPTVTAEIVKHDGHWIFVNFHYPDPKPSGSDLLSILKELREDRHRLSK